MHSSREIYSNRVPIYHLWLAAAALLAVSAIAAGPSRPRPERYQMEISFAPDRGFFHAKVTLALRADAPLDAVELELNPKLKILEITDGQGRNLSFDRGRLPASPLFLVRLPAPTSGEFILTFTYEGAPVSPRDQLDYIRPDGILLRDDLRWYPAPDYSAFTQNDISITVPASLDALASGDLIARSANGAQTTFRWRTSRPVSSPSLVAYPQRLSSMTASLHGPFPAPILIQEAMPTTSAPEPKISAGDLSGRASHLLARFSRELGPYPHSAFRIVPGFPGQRGAIGYTAPGFLVVSDDVMKYQHEPAYEPEFLPHEIAHQWFPSEVTLAGESDGWLAESLAEYLALRSLEETRPAQAGLLVERAMRDALAPNPLRPLRLGLRLFALEDWDVTYATLYQRGMLVFRTLESVIGRDQLDRALRLLYQRKAGSTASIADFQQICEEVSGKNLDWFFQYFIEGTRLPDISLEPIPTAAARDIKGRIVARDVPAEFAARISLRLQTPRGPEDHSVELRGAATSLGLTASSPVSRITLDPDLRLLRWTEAARRNRRQLALLPRQGSLERAGRYNDAALVCRRALALDPGDLAKNAQQFHFELGRLLYRAGKLEAAWQEFGRAFASGSLSSTTTDFYRAWSRVYRVRIARKRGQLAVARAETRAALALTSSALDRPISWPDISRRPTTAREQLEPLAR